MYTMCTGRPAFRADNAVAVLRRVADDAPRPIREVNAEIPEWLCEIIEKLIEKDAEDRFESAEEVAIMLSQHLAHLQRPESAEQPARVGPSATRTLETTEKKLKSTANFLWATGILSLVSTGLAVMVLIAKLRGEGPPHEATAFIVGGFLSLPLSLAIMVGAHHAERRTSYSWAMTACCLSLLPFNPFLICLDSCDNLDALMAAPAGR